jgi:hypothetical protein
MLSVAANCTQKYDPRQLSAEARRQVYDETEQLARGCLKSLTVRPALWARTPRPRPSGVLGRLRAGVGA